MANIELTKANWANDLVESLRLDGVLGGNADEGALADVFRQIDAAAFNRGLNFDASPPTATSEHPKGGWQTSSLVRRINAFEHWGRILAAGVVAIGFTLYFVRDPVYRAAERLVDQYGFPEPMVTLGPRVLTSDGREMVNTVDIRPGPVEILFRDRGHETWIIEKAGVHGYVIKRNGQMLAEHGRTRLNGIDYLVVGPATQEK